MDLQAILDRFEFRPEPEATLTEAVADLRAAILVLMAAMESGSGASELDAALRTSRDRIQTCYGIIEAHGFEKPIVDGSTAVNGRDLDWAEIDAVVGSDDGDVGSRLESIFETVDFESEAVEDRIREDRLDLLATVPSRLPDPADADSIDPQTYQEALLLVAAVAYFLSGFGTHPVDHEPAADRVFQGYWLVTAVLTAE